MVLNINCRVTWAKKWRGIARNFAPGYSNYHIWKGKVLHNHNWREWGHIECNPEWLERYKIFLFFIFDMIPLKIAYIRQFCCKFIYSWPDNQKLVFVSNTLNFHDFSFCNMYAMLLTYSCTHSVLSCCDIHCRMSMKPIPIPKCTPLSVQGTA